MRKITDEYLLSKIDKDGHVPQHMPTYGKCWIWTGAKQKNNGGIYGYFGRRPVKKAWYWTYDQVHGKVPDGLILDHLCRYTLCVNPDHLQAVTNHVNILRGENTAAKYARRTHCNNGHEYTTENTRITKAGARLCRTCRRITSRQEKARAKERKSHIPIK